MVLCLDRYLDLFCPGLRPYLNLGFWLLNGHLRHQKILLMFGPEDYSELELYCTTAQGPEEPELGWFID